MLQSCHNWWVRWFCAITFLPHLPLIPFFTFLSNCLQITIFDSLFLANRSECELQWMVLSAMSNGMSGCLVFFHFCLPASSFPHSYQIVAFHSFPKTFPELCLLTQCKELLLQITKCHPSLPTIIWWQIWMVPSASSSVRPVGAPWPDRLARRHHLIQLNSILWNLCELSGSFS